MEQPTPTDRTRVKQIPNRGKYDQETIRAIIDEGLVAHVGFADGDQAFVIPMGYGRMDDQIVIHGGQEARIAQVVRRGAPLCITVTLLDGLVLAKSALHHSMNYRSVVVLGTAREILEASEKLEALRCVVEHIIPGRWDETRRPNDAELKATAVFTLPLSEASAKIRTGSAVDARADLELPYWAGEIPIRTTVLEPIPAETVPSSSPLPAHVRDYRR
ncbi:MAG: pyridoxamine 5'-phosphate oxidase family protein [Planctomycetota bacterium]|nr:pyridoxamine 5'-phosphate oxidase family protein [Planctomycetota bacterium]